MARMTKAEKLEQEKRNARNEKRRAGRAATSANRKKFDDAFARTATKMNMPNGTLSGRQTQQVLNEMKKNKNYQSLLSGARYVEQRGGTIGVKSQG